MKIFIISEDVYHTRRWVLSLAQAGNSVFLFALGSIVNQKLYDIEPNIQYYSAGVASYMFKAKGLKKIKYLLAVNDLRRCIKLYNPDILHAHYATSNGLLGRIVGFHPLIISVWGSDVYHFPRISFFHKCLFKFILKRADLILSTSNVMAKEVNKYVNRDILVTPFGVDMEKFNLIEKCRNSDGSIIIGNVKALEPNYGIDTLIKAFSLILKQNPHIDIRLVIIGDGSQKSDLILLSKQLDCFDKIDFLGVIDNSLLPYYYSLFSVYVSLSNTESFGVVAVEAMACQCPVVVSDAEGFKEVVVSGETGYIVPKRNPQEAAKAIQTLINQPELRRKFGRAGRNHVLKLYNWNNNVDFMLKIYNKLLSNENNCIA